MEHQEEFNEKYTSKCRTNNHYFERFFAIFSTLYICTEKNEETEILMFKEPSKRAAEELTDLVFNEVSLDE